MSRVLLGESQEDLAIALREGFTAEHFTVEIENNGLRILECLRHKQYEVIILEIALAGLDGISVVRDYRASGGNIPILLLASKHSSKDLKTCLVKHLTLVPLKFAEVNPDLNIDKELENIVQRCMAKEVENRFQSARDVSRALRIYRARKSLGII